VPGRARLYVAAEKQTFATGWFGSDRDCAPPARDGFQINLLDREG